MEELNFRFGSSLLEKIKNSRILKIINVKQVALQKIEHIKLKWREHVHRMNAEG